MNFMHTRIFYAHERERDTDSEGSVYSLADFFEEGMCDDPPVRQCPWAEFLSCFLLPVCPCRTAWKYVDNMQILLNVPALITAIKPTITHEIYAYVPILNFFLSCLRQ